MENPSIKEADVVHLDPRKTANELSEIDRLRIQCADERAARMQAQLEVMAVKAEQAKENFRTLVSQACENYNLGASDNISLDTGIITRGAKA